MPYQYRCPFRAEKTNRGVDVQCKWCDEQGKMLMVLNHNNNKNKGILCPENITKPIILDYEGVSFDNMPQEYLPELNKNKNKTAEE